MAEPGDAPKPMIERRANPRRRVLLTGKLTSPELELSSDCTVSNLSDGGAFVRTDPVALPSEPFLIVVKHATVHRAQAAWRCAEGAGLKFLGAWRLQGQLPEGPAKFRQLWVELSRR